MLSKSIAVAALALVVLGAGVGPRLVSEAHAGCDVGERIDGSTADTARKKMEMAGFRQVHDLKKGCDNFWHGHALKDGAAVNIVLSPQGEVLIEGD